MTWEWIRFGLTALLILGGLFAMFCSVLGLYLFDFALNRIHSAALSDTLSLLLFMAGIMLATGFHPLLERYGSRLTGLPEGTEFPLLLKLLLVLLFQWCTAPLSSHMLAKFEYKVDENLTRHVEVLDAQYYQEVDEP